MCLCVFVCVGECVCICVCFRCVCRCVCVRVSQVYEMWPTRHLISEENETEETTEESCPSYRVL